MYFLRFRYGQEERRATSFGSSPELLVRVHDRGVEYRPIAGTRPRGADEATDRAFEADLRADEKEVAEHIMLVDLGRNDVGRVSEFGSVKVKNLMFVETLQPRDAPGQLARRQAEAGALRHRCLQGLLPRRNPLRRP